MWMLDRVLALFERVVGRCVVWESRPRLVRLDELPVIVAVQNEDGEMVVVPRLEVGRG